MSDFKSITLSNRGKSIEIINPRNLPLLGTGGQGAVFKISETQCVKIFFDPTEARREADALKAGEDLPFIPKLYGAGSNYVVMEYIPGVNLKEYLNNCTYIPDTIVTQLHFILKELRRARFAMLDMSIEDIIVTPDGKLKVIDHVYSLTKYHPMPFKLLRDLNVILLKDSFLLETKRRQPNMYKSWEKYKDAQKFNYREIAVSSKSGDRVSTDSGHVHTLIGKGHQGAVYRVSETKCVKIYGRSEHAEREKEVLLDHQKLAFIPKVYETGENFILMEYLAGPDLNTFLKKQSKLSEEVTRRLLTILTSMEKAGFSKIDAPLRHTIITSKGFKLIDHVYSYSIEQDYPFELFKDLHERKFLGDFLSQVKTLAPKTHAKWVEALDQMMSKGQELR